MSSQNLNPKQLEEYLEQYTLARSQELLLVTIDIEGITEEIMIFKGFSSCLSRATESDPDLPIIPATAKIITIDRLQAPYNPTQPIYIERGLTWAEFSLNF
jgi:hypothetical protein